MNEEQELLTEDIGSQKEETIMAENDTPTPPVPPAPVPVPPNGGNDKMPYEGRTNIDDFLTVRGFGGYGYGGGYGGGGYGGGHTGDSFLSAKSHAEGTAIGANILANRDLDMASHRDLSRDIDKSFRTMEHDNLSKEHVDLERRVNDQNAALIGTLNDVRAESAKCCCEAKLLATENKSEILAAIAAQTTDSITRELDAANSRITQLETINAIMAGDGHGGHRK